MKRLCLYRHAKSDWSDPAHDDFARPLNARGKKAAAFMADFIANSPYRPDAVLCSTAKRALETFAPLGERLGASTKVHYRDELYHAMPDVLLEEIQGAPGDADTLLVVAHNPGLAFLAAALPEDADDPTAARVADGLPTGGFIVVEFDVDQWSEVDEAEGRIIFFGRPRDLMATTSKQPLN